jgi:hypothetical protein
MFRFAGKFERNFVFAFSIRIEACTTNTSLGGEDSDRALWLTGRHRAPELVRAPAN